MNLCGHAKDHAATSQSAIDLPCGSPELSARSAERNHAPQKKAHPIRSLNFLRGWEKIAILLLTFATACRRSEIAALTISKIPFREGGPHRHHPLIEDRSNG
jgi:integrase